MEARLLFPEIARWARTRAERIARTEPDFEKPYSGPLGLLGTMVRAAENVEGHLIVRVIAAELARNPALNVETNVHVPISRDARILAAANPARPSSELQAAPTGRGTKVDLMVNGPDPDEATFLEGKRGLDRIGADHRRELLSRGRCLEMIGCDAATRVFEHPIRRVRFTVFSYYNATGMPPEITLPGKDLDEQFAWPLVEPIEAHLTYFRHELDRLVPGLAGKLHDPLTALADGTLARALTPAIRRSHGPRGRGRAGPA